MSGNRGRSGLVIQQRDRQLLTEVATMRIIDRELAKLAAGFRSTTRANTRLLKLTRAGLLNRFFVGTVGAGRKAIYTLSTRGAALVNAPRPGISRRHGKTLIGDLFVAHQMHINEIYVMLKWRALPPGIRFMRWRSFHEPLTAGAPLIPDGYFEIQTAAGIRSMFLEVDLGTEALRIWEQKSRAYLQLAVSGDFVRMFRQPQFRVLTVASASKRLRNIQSVIAKQTEKLFWLSTFEPINREGLWSPIWLRPKGDQTLSLI